MTRSPGFTSARFDTRSIVSGGSWSPPTTMPPARVRSMQCASRGIPVDEQLDARGVRGRRPDDAADDPGRRDDRHIRLDAVSDPLPYRDRQHTGIGVPRDDFCRDGRQRTCSSADSAVPAAASPGAASASLFSAADLTARHLPLERLVLRPGLRVTRRNCPRHSRRSAEHPDVPPWTRANAPNVTA